MFERKKTHTCKIHLISIFYLQCASKIAKFFLLTCVFSSDFFLYNSCCLFKMNSLLIQNVNVNMSFITQGRASGDRTSQLCLSTPREIIHCGLRFIVYVSVVTPESPRLP